MQWLFGMQLQLLLVSAVLLLLVSALLPGCLADQRGGQESQRSQGADSSCGSA